MEPSSGRSNPVASGKYLGFESTARRAITRSAEAITARITATDRDRLTDN
jgi:hypothetical protein